MTSLNHVVETVPEGVDSSRNVANAKRRPSVLLISCYELGHQPFAVASARAHLQSAGFTVETCDTSIDVIEPSRMRADLVAISVPMHTALRLGVSIARKVSAAAPDAHINFFGLYATLNAAYLLRTLADSVIGGEFEDGLVALAESLRDREKRPSAEARGVVFSDASRSGGRTASPIMKRLMFHVPDRKGLPPLEKYAHLIGPSEGETRLTGYVEGSRGCLHKCLHCPITPVYNGRFFIVQKDVVLADAEQQIRAGARHITFGDPDFFNGPTHSMGLMRAIHAAYPDVTFDVTVKVEHILKHREKLRELRALGCVFLVSAVESMSDVVLRELDKGHTAEDVKTAFHLTRAAGIALRPSFVAFTPWTTAEDYIELSSFILREGLVGHVDPIQLAIRLLIPPGSALLWGERERPWLRGLVDDEFGYRWEHPDPRMDVLYNQVLRIVEEDVRAEADAVDTFRNVRRASFAAAGRKEAPAERDERINIQEGFVPKLSEAWFCCAEPPRHF